MDRVAVFVDAGYLFAQGSKAVCARDQPLPRRRIELHRKTAIDKFKNIACQCSGLPLLRIYWYDGTSSGPTSDHTKLAREHDVKVRLGFVNAGGDQKELIP